MLFSIIVPVYNVAAWLKDCIESILRQSCDNYELILIDDGSTDESGSICDIYAQKYSQIKIIHKNNGGLSDARNCGIGSAGGKYLLFIDSDDYIEEWALEKASENIELYDPDVILSEGIYKVEQSQIVLDKRLDRSLFDGKTGEEALLETTKIRANWSAAGKIFRRSFWQEKNFQFKLNRLAEDFQLIDKIIIEAKKVCGMEPYYYYRVRSGSIIHSYNPKRYDDRWRNLEDWTNYFKTREINPILKNQLYTLYANLIREVCLEAVFIYDIEDATRWINEAEKYLDYFKYSNYWKDKMIFAISKMIGIRKFIELYGKLKGEKLGGE